MKIKQVEISNFKTIKRKQHEPTAKIMALTGDNGVGKTSFIEAIRYGITGERPDNPIKYGEKQMSVEITLDDGTVFTRELKEHLDGTQTQVKVNGKRTTLKALSELLEYKTGVNQPAMKMISSGELLAAMRPDELGTLMLKYIPDEQDLDSVIGFLDMPAEIENQITSEIQMLFPAMPQKFGMDTIEEGYKSAFDIRRDFRKERDNSKARAVAYIGEPPRGDKRDLEAQLNNVIKAEGAQEALKQAISAYNQALANKQKQDAQIKDLQARINSNTAQKPNPALLNNITQAQATNKANILTVNNIIQVINKDIAFLKKTLKELNEPVCPISNKLVCTTDKTEIRDELEELVKSNEEGLEFQTQQLAKLQKEEISLIQQEASYRQSETAYNQKVNLVEQLRNIQNNPITLPTKPRSPLNGQTADYQAEKQRIKHELDRIDRYEKHQEELKKLKALETKVQVYDFIVKTLAPKGCVQEGIMDYYVPIFEQACNTKAHKLKPGFTMKLTYDSGVNVSCETKAGKGYKDYASLSSGEKVFAQFLLLDMFNSLTGFKMLLLDDLDKLDKGNFEALVNLITEQAVQDEYDHIVIAAVAHDDTTEILKKSQSDIEWVSL